MGESPITPPPKKSLTVSADGALIVRVPVVSTPGVLGVTVTVPAGSLITASSDDKSLLVVVDEVMRVRAATAAATTGGDTDAVSDDSGPAHSIAGCTAGSSTAGSCTGSSGMAATDDGAINTVCSSTPAGVSNDDSSSVSTGLLVAGPTAAAAAAAAVCFCLRIIDDALPPAMKSAVGAMSAVGTVAEGGGGTGKEAMDAHASTCTLALARLLPTSICLTGWGLRNPCEPHGGGRGNGDGWVSDVPLRLPCMRAGRQILRAKIHV